MERIFAQHYCRRYIRNFADVVDAGRAFNHLLFHEMVPIHLLLHLFWFSLLHIYLEELLFLLEHSLTSLPNLLLLLYYFSVLCIYFILFVEWQGLIVH